MLTEEEEYNMLNDLIFYYKRDDIDLINLHKAEPGLKLVVSRKGRVIYEENNAFTDFQLYAASIYADTKHLRDMRDQILKGRINKL